MTNDQAPMTRQFPNPKSQIPNRICVPFLAILILLAVMNWSLVAMAQQPKSGPAPAAGALEVVMAGKPARKTLTLTTTQPARIEALEQAPIYSKLSAYVGQVLVDYGDKVKKDDPLLKLVAPELDTDL